MYLMASGWIEFLTTFDNWLAILMVALGLGLVIFVHELGHFAVAKMCGVKCEKFYLGFDINGLRLFRFRWGETEYGIGILPLGGYVKMLGQDDNPAKMREEMERAKVQTHAKPEQHGDMPVSVESEAAVAYDPRSYLAKSVPQRMAIISAGVIMNLIFAVIFAAIAYGIGVKEIPCLVSEVSPGGAAWQAGLRPGDEIVQLGNIKHPWRSDVQRVVPTGDTGTSYDCLINRPGERETVKLTLRPKPGPAGVTLLGVGFSGTTQLPEKLGESKYPTEAGSPARLAEPGFRFGDTIVAVDGKPVNEGFEITIALSDRIDQAVKFTVDRNVDNAAGDSKGRDKQDKVATEKVDVTVAAKPLRLFGLALSVSPIDAVQDDSPAAKAGIQPGDVLERIDGQPLGDPMTLGQTLSRRIGQSVKLTISRTNDGKTETLEKDVVLAKSPVVEMGPITYNSPVAVGPLGIAFHVLDTVTGVEPGSPADKAGIKPGDVIAEVAFVAPKKDESKANEEAEVGKIDTEPLHLNAGRANWPVVIAGLQLLPEKVKLKVTIGAGKDARSVELEPTDSDRFYALERGLVLRSRFEVRRGETLGECLQLGLRKTGDSLYMVVGFLKKLVRNDISPFLLGGPIEIGSQAFRSALEGFSAFLLFLTMVSANLAVINFLPIPVLDGGHMVFLAYEGIRRKPVTENLINILSLAGFLFLISLMLFVFSLDLHIIPRISNR